MTPTRRLFLAAAPVAALAQAGGAEPRRSPAGVYVAVGYGGRRLRSADGKTWDIAAEWTVNGGDDRNNLISVAFGHGKFVAVGGGVTDKNGPGGRVLTSADGKEWTELPVGYKFRVHPVVFGNERFVAGGPDYRLLHSPDGTTWTAGGTVADKAATHFRMGAFGNGRFVFVGNGRKAGAEFHWAVSSRDGTTIDGERGNLPPVRALAFGAGRFVAVGPDGLRVSSADGLLWDHEVRGGDPKLVLDAVVWTGREFLASGGGKGFASADGLAWAAWPKPVPCSVLYADAARGVWIGTGWPGQMWHSADGLTWTRGAKLTPNGINAVAYGEVG